MRTTRNKVQALQDKVHALEKSEAHMCTAMVDSQLEHSVALKIELDQARLRELEFSDAMAETQDTMTSMREEAVSADATIKELRNKLAAQSLRAIEELHSMARIVEGCVGAAEALMMPLQCAQYAILSNKQSQTHEMGLLKTKVAALEREQQQVCSARDEARQQPAELMDKVRTSAQEHHIWKEELERENVRAQRQREEEIERQIAEAATERERALRAWELERQDLAQEQERERESWAQDRAAQLLTSKHCQIQRTGRVVEQHGLRALCRSSTPSSGYGQHTRLGSPMPACPWGA